MFEILNTDCINSEKQDPLIPIKSIKEKVEILLQEDSWDDIFLEEVQNHIKDSFRNLSTSFPLSYQSIPSTGSFGIRKEWVALHIDRIEAYWHGKLIILYIIACAINHNIKQISLKAEPIWASEKRKSLEDLIWFYSSFWFKRWENLANGVKMTLNLDNENGKVLLTKLFHFINH